MIGAVIRSRFLIKPAVVNGVDAYLDRLKLSRPIELNLASLAALQRAHLRHIPYENLDIIAGHPIDFAESALRQKLLTPGRGGFCYELNFAFASLLRDLGFAPQIRAARVFDAHGQPGPLFGHPVIVVTLEEPWLVDVGHARWTHEPLRWDHRNWQAQDEYEYRFEKSSEGLKLWQRSPYRAAAVQYEIELTPRVPEDFEAMCRIQCLASDSRYRRSLVCARALESGRLLLLGSRRIRLAKGQREEIPLSSVAEIIHSLREDFGIAAAPELLETCTRKSLANQAIDFLV